jgi:hypothetical protein
MAVNLMCCLVYVGFVQEIGTVFGQMLLTGQMLLADRLLADRAVWLCGGGHGVG